MGFKEQKQLWDKLRECAPSAFISMLPFSRTRNVIISDGPTRTRYKLGPKFNYMFTGVDFFNMFMDPIREALKGGTLFYIECFDRDEIGVREKRREQAKRSEGRKKSDAKKKPEDKGIRYPSSVQICEGGIRTEDGVTPFDIRGITASSTLRRKAMVFVAEMLVNEPLPVGTSVILDFLETPMQFVRQHGTLQNVCFSLDKFRHLFSEAEPQMAFWARIFSKPWDEKSVQPTIICRSTDSDMIAILGHLVESTKPTCPIILERGKIVRFGPKPKLKEGATPPPTHHPLVNFNELVAVLNTADIHMWQIVLLANAFGSDWCEKPNLTPGSGLLKSWPMFLEFKDRFKAIKFTTGDLLTRGKVTLWESWIRNPALRKEQLVYFQDIDDSFPSPTIESKTNPTNYEKSEDVVLSFCRNLPGARGASLEANKIGCVDLFFALQYQQFPWQLINVRPPSVYIEKEDRDADEERRKVKQ